ncbi:CHASE2 domain-containing protein [Variovorax sp. DT-64]|uniref:CHASE2 domain-containing protein n=1 Tax=Variovorax sp. DT-64 TaxID=3396160 RepID=UPI003F1C0ADA
MPDHRTTASSPRLPWRWLEWLGLAILVAGLVLVVDRTGWLQGPNRWLQDALMFLQARPADRSAVVIVAIDDKSVAALGRWPWRRSFHAQLIDRIDKDGPRAIGMDLLLIEPDQRYPADEAALAAALGRSGKVVLPLMMQSHNGEPVVVEPLPALRRRAGALGHVHLDIDNDGVARSVYLREGLGGRQWDHFSVAMRKIGEGRADAPPRKGDAEAGDADGVPAWQRSRRLTISFAGPPGHFRQVSYVDVLDGTVAPGTFEGKYVLIGATAAGLGDLYATPVSNRSRLMSGVELSANVLDSLESGRSMAPLPARLNAAFNLLPALLALAGMAFVGPLAALLLTLTLVLLPVAAAAGAARYGLQFAPAAGMLGVAAAYGLWSWRKLDAATRYLMEEFRRLHADSRMAGLSGPALGSGDFVGRRIDALGQVAEQLRNLQRQRDDAMRFLSHDMRAPLASILALLNLQRENPSALAPEQVQERIERHARKALGLADDFTQLVRAQSHSYRFESCNLVDVLLECVDDAWEATRRHGIEIVMSPAPDLAHSRIDRDLVARAITNLLGNALKFSPAGSSVRCAIEALPHEWAVLVQDQGPGIDEELRAQLFEPFARGRAGFHVEGAGLGLAFVKTVAQRHGGRVVLESVPGQGSAFRLILPRA